MTQKLPWYWIFTCFHVRKRLWLITTMMAALAPGKPPPCLNTLATLSLIPEDDEVLAFLAECAPNIAFKTKNNCGTQMHIAHHITKTPSQCHTTAHQHDNLSRLTWPPTARCSPSSADDEDEGFHALLPHPPHYHLEQHNNHYAAVMPATTYSFPHQPPTMHQHASPVKTTSALPTDTKPTSTSTSTLNDVSSDLSIAVEAFQQWILKEFCSLLKLPMPKTMMPKPYLPLHQNDLSPMPPPQIPTLATVPRWEPDDLNQQTHHNNNHPAQHTAI